MSDEPKLTNEAKRQIRREFYRIAAPTGVFLTILSFVLGFVAKDYGTMLAYKDAFSSAQGATTEQITTLAAEVARAQELAKKAEEETNKLLESVKTTEQVTKNANDVNDIAQIVSNNTAFQNRIKQQLRSWKEVTNDKDFFKPECEYRWLIVEGFQGYNGSYFYPSVVTREFMTTDWSRGNYRTVNYNEKNKSLGDHGTFKARTFCRCN
ncbi:MAG: hypothetical protein ABJH98_03385 [Reichenbachiella sp.]|uniref:hypothetical protein n=1 Tax=Reichenbachiella sp. TaxID=2184521 RepID=UPI003298E06D